MTYEQKIIKEFQENFVNENRGSSTNLWWKIPKTSGGAEVASPREVEFFILKALEGYKKKVREELEKMKHTLEPKTDEPSYNDALDKALEILEKT